MLNNTLRGSLEIIMKKYITTLFFSFFLLINTSALANEHGKTAEDNKAAEDSCEAPAWAKAIGHEHMWKLHNGCITQAEYDKATKE